jgi:hypothetical protein
MIVKKRQKRPVEHSSITAIILKLSLCLLKILMKVHWKRRIGIVNDQNNRWDIFLRSKAMPMYRLHVEAVYSFDFLVEAENEEAATKLFEDMSEEDLFAFIDVGEEPDEYVFKGRGGY